MKKHSKQRDAVYSALCRLGNHPTAAEVYDKVRAEMPHISLATVYRNLSDLAADGLALVINMPDSVTRYDGNVYEHNHLNCSKCGKVVDIDLDVSVNTGAVGNCEISGYSVMFFGKCCNCINL